MRNISNTEKWKILKCRIYCTVLQKCNIRTNFCERFAIILNENLTHVVFFHAHVGPFIAQTSAHCFDVAKKTLLSENTYDILTRAGPKTLPKKSVKKLVRASLLSKEHQDRTKK